MATYYNAKGMLPQELIAEVLQHIPDGNRNGAVIYFSEDYYSRRNTEIARCFQIYQSDPKFGSSTEIYEALSEEYGLTVRQICKIVREIIEPSGVRHGLRRNYSGVRVTRSSRRMNVRTVVC